MQTYLTSGSLKTMLSHRQRATQLKTVQDFVNGRVTVDKTIALEIRGSRLIAKNVYSQPN